MELVLLCNFVIPGSVTSHWQHLVFIQTVILTGQNRDGGNDFLSFKTGNTEGLWIQSDQLIHVSCSCELLQLQRRWSAAWQQSHVLQLAARLSVTGGVGLHRKWRLYFKQRVNDESEQQMDRQSLAGCHSLVLLDVNHIAAHYLLNDSLLKALNSINHKSYFCCVFSRMSAEDLFMKAAYFMETS